MLHEMNLYNDSFISIKDGYKTIEMRLNDEKRQLIKPNDLIEFTNTKTLEKIKVIVLETIHYANFEELYKQYTKIEIGYKEDENSDPSDMENYYSKDKIKKYGALAIRVCLLDKLTYDIMLKYNLIKISEHK